MDNFYQNPTQGKPSWMSDKMYQQAQDNLSRPSYMTAPISAFGPQSKRFGIAASLPEKYWPDITDITRGKEVAGASGAGQYGLTYNRTGRPLGNITNYGGHVNPNAADAVLDYSEGLGRIDPNRYHYNLTDLTRQNYSYNPAFEPTRLSASPTLTGYAAESKQQANPLINDFSQKNWG
jgi:hypothetical protein